MVETKLSDGKWLALGLISDVGWLLYFAGFTLYLLSGADGLGTVILSAAFLLNAAAALSVLTGIVELISQRIRKLDRRLKKSQVIMGFGCCVCGGLAGGLVSLFSAAVDLLFHYETGMCFAAQCMMAVGGLLCFGFGLPIWRSFRPETALSN